MTPYRECWRLAWPLILANLSIPMLGLVDTAVVGHLPEPHYLAAVALGAMTMSMLYFLFGFLRMGTTGLVAQAFGARDALEMRAIPIRALLLAAALGLLLILLTPVIAGMGELIFAPAPLVGEGFRTYLTIRIFGAPAALGSFVILGWLLGLQDSRGPLALLVITNVVNAALAFALVLGLGWGVAGVATATLIAEYLGFAAGLGIALWRSRLLGLALPDWAHVRHRRSFMRLLTVNRDIFLRSAMLQTTFMTFTALGSRQGEVVLAANAVLMNFFTAASFGLDGFAHACEAMVGRAVGGRNLPALRAAVRAGAALAAALALGLTALFWLAGDQLIGLLTDIESVRATATAYLPFAALLPAIAVWAFLLDGVFFGATRTAELRNAMIGALLVFVAGAAVLPAALGNAGLWSTLLLFLLARAAFLAAIYWRSDAGAAFVSSRPVSS
jgi:MATE family multidrug resistance protein